MLDPLSSLSIATAIAQFLEVAIKLLRTTRKLAQSKSGTLDAFIVLQKELDDFEAHVATLESSTAPLSFCAVPEDSKMKVYVESCRLLTKKVRDAMDDLKIRGAPNTMKALGVAVRIQMRGRDLAKFQEQLDKNRRELALYWAERIYQKQDITNRDTRSAIAAVLDTLNRRGAAMDSSVAYTLSGVRKDLKEVLENTSKQREELGKMSAAFHRTIDEARRAAANASILSSLRFKGIWARHESVQNHYGHTFNWILGDRSDDAEGSQPVRKLDCSRALTDWLTCGHGIFWISGKAGSGKSTLMKFLRDHPGTMSYLTKWASGHELVVASHFFWNAGGSMEKSRKGLLQSICFDVLRQIPGRIRDICPQRWQDAFNQADPYSFNVGAWSEDELCELMESIVCMITNSQGSRLRLCLFIDGLDEYDGGYLERKGLISMLDGLVKHESVKICASSRPWNEFREHFGNLSDNARMMTLQDITWDDIDLYIRGMLEAEPEFQLLQMADYRAEDLITDITKKADGVFLWVTLTVRELIEGIDNSDSIPELRHRLDQLPPDLESFYKLMFDRLPKTYQQQSAQILLMCCEAPERLPLLSYCVLDRDNILATRVADNYYERINYREQTQLLDRLRKLINSRCRDMLIVPEVRIVGTVPRELFVGFLHRTVRDYFREESMQQMLFARAGRSFNLRKALCHSWLVVLRYIEDIYDDSSEANPGTVYRHHFDTLAGFIDHYGSQALGDGEETWTDLMDQQMFLASLPRYNIGRNTCRKLGLVSSGLISSLSTL